MKTETIKERTNCRVCGVPKLLPILSLGDQYTVGFLQNPKEQTVKAPLDLVLCDASSGGCGLLQLKHTIDHDLLYRQYWYKSGISTTMVKALADIVRCAEQWTSLRHGDIVVDIGSNDGTLLRQYDEPDIVKVGFEPSNLCALGRQPGTTIIHDYFNAAAFEKHFKNRKAKVVTSIAMFYDLEAPDAFVESVRHCLDKDGLWIIQMNYLGLMLDNNTFDNISHEHLEYYSLLSLEVLLQKHAFQVLDVELNDVNGGSFRILIGHRDGELQPLPGAPERVEALRQRERERGLCEKRGFDAFVGRLGNIKTKLHAFLREEKRKGKRIYIYGASTRGLVVLQYAGIDNTLIDAAVDKNADKWGRYITGTGIRVIPFVDYRTNLPDYLFVLPYQFKDEILRQEKDFVLKGGRMIFALPEFDVVGGEYFSKEGQA
ncbi:MAG: methyltransferase domain-containing protein [Lentisphaerae bacterium]|nr:methyltransferase domain-containing protein [Lentisphaerota bacterium]